MAIGSTPVASGSSVPPCPTFCAWVSRLTTLTTWVDVISGALSITSQPLIGRPLALRRPICIVLPVRQRLLGVLQQLADPRRIGERLIRDETQSGRILQVHLPGQPAAQVGCGLLQRLGHFVGELAPKLGRKDRGS